MKPILFLLFFIPLFTSAQKIALIDRNFYEPITMVDTVSIDDASKGSLVVYKEDIAKVIEGMEWLAKYLSYSEKLTSGSFDITMGNSKCIVITEKTGSKYSHNIMLHTNSENIKHRSCLLTAKRTKEACNGYICLLIT